MAISGRVTESSIHNRVLANLQRNIARSEKIHDQLSSGKQINRPSDSPTGTVSALQLRTESRANEQYVRNANDGLGWLTTVESALNSSSTLMNRARDLTVQGLNTATGSAHSNAALATEVEQIRDSLIAYANTRFLDRPVFGGTTAGPAAYDSTTGAYLGNDGQTMRTVASGTKVRVDTTGPAAFGTGDTEVFTVLQTIADGLRAGDTAALSDGLSKLDTASNVLRTAVSDVGARYNRITQAKESAQDRLLSVTSQLSDIEDIDLPKTIMEMQLQQTSYQAALAASAKVIQPSLIDFLR
ncbi:flagellar hook-associated protein FlgL [Jidongwangia harbinensis]|uniref:flagellar hook-associated protein FlgL n=1 Tax=Jidongwangia harbinensis TaxID=2878561 RepID=UPI001CD9CEC7|nr:flagellar hook-associated protein FlgL [Jidongwangia harbinensis]MCA2213725.1 flagellar hook-associated protein FlgL [Jidongwangia harbinensis]